MSRRLLVLLSLLALSLVAASGCGGSPASTEDADPAEAVPASSLFFGSVQIRPEGEAKEGAEAAGRKILGREPGPEIQKLLERALEDADARLSYAEDVEPWLGRRAAVAVTGVRGTEVDAALLVTATDEDAAQAALDEVAARGARPRSYRDVDYRVEDDRASGMVEGYLVAGTEAGFRSVVDTLQGGPALADDGRYTRATATVTEDGLGLFFVDPKRFVDVLAQGNPAAAAALGPLRGLPQLRDAEPTAAALTADADAIRVEVPAGPEGDETAADAIAELPADSWLAFAAPGAGEAIRGQLDALRGAQGQVIAQLEALLRRQTGLDLDRDLLDWIDGVSVFASGTTLPQLKVALLLTSSDPAASARTVSRIQGLLRRQNLPLSPVPGGFQVKLENLPAPLTLTADGPEVLAAYGDGVRQALDGPKLEDGEAYALARRALGGGRPSFLLSVPPILEFAENLGANGNDGYRRAKPYLDAFGAITAGVTERDGRRRGRFAVGLR